MSTKWFSMLRMAVMNVAINYNIISTGSEGNAVVINDTILIDCGVSFKALSQYYKALKLVLLTHKHSDHFNKTCIKLLARERPTLRFGCGRWLVDMVVQCGVPKQNIDVLEFDTRYMYGICDVIPVPLVHGGINNETKRREVVPNCGYKIHFPTGNGYKKMIYATDTNCLNGISARHYDLYMIEANHEEEVIKQKIRDKKASGEYAYENHAKENHLSKEKADDFIYKNIGANGVYVYLHCHKEETT
jgi:phosphoribosyl 1,2-cyclic phosphodiesterase